MRRAVSRRPSQAPTTSAALRGRRAEPRQKGAKGRRRECRRFAAGKLCFLQPWLQAAWQQELRCECLEKGKRDGAARQSRVRFRQGLASGSYSGQSPSIVGCVRAIPGRPWTRADAGSRLIGQRSTTPRLAGRPGGADSLFGAEGAAWCSSQLSAGEPDDARSWAQRRRRRALIGRSGQVSASPPLGVRPHQAAPAATQGNSQRHRFRISRSSSWPGHPLDPPRRVRGLLFVQLCLAGVDERRRSAR